jgi:hypothetical protein
MSEQQMHPPQTFDTETIREDIKELKGDVRQLTSKFDVLTGVLSVRCQAEGARINSIENRIHDAAVDREKQIGEVKLLVKETISDLEKRYNGLLSRVWGLFAALMVAGAAAFVAHMLLTK